jgi:hypothetical protein
VDKKEAYEEHVLRSLGAFLSIIYPSIDDIIDDFPRTFSAIEDYYKQGTSPNNAAIQLGAVIISINVARMDHNDRAIVIKELSELNDQDYEKFLALSRLEGDMSFPDGKKVGTVLIATTTASARDALKRGLIGPVSFEAFETEVSKALNGERDAQVGKGE